MPSILVLFVVTFLDSLVHYSYFFWTSRYLPKLGLPENWIAAGDEHRPDRRDRHDGLARACPQAAGLADDDDPGYPGPCGAVRHLFDRQLPRHLALAGHPEQHRSWFAYAFFFATVYIYVDENFPKDVRTSAQSLFNLLILGLGPLREQLSLGLAAETFSRPREGEIQYHYELFLVPLGLGLLAAVILAIFFHPEAKEPVPKRFPSLSTKNGASAHPCRWLGGWSPWPWRRLPRSPRPTPSSRGI